MKGACKNLNYIPKETVICYRAHNAESNIRRAKTIIIQFNVLKAEEKS